MVITINKEINLSASLENQACLKRYVRENLIPYRFLNYGRLTKLSKCIGLIGPRGSCKSLSASAMSIIDYLVPGYELLSNMGVTWGLRFGDYIVGYQSETLDKAAMLNFDINDRVVVLADEVNVEFSEARRSMTNRNLIFNKVIQQLRKRKMNFIYSVQHEMWIDMRLRWQTDFFIKCRDICLQPGGLHLPYDFGEFASWTVYDMSGYLGQGSYIDTQRPVIENWRFHGKPWWDTFDTDQLQGIEEPVPIEGTPMRIKRADYIVKEEENLATVYDTIMDLHNQGVCEIASNDLFNIFGIKTHKEKTYVGKILKSIGIQYQEWNKCYAIPDADLNKPETMRKPEVLVSQSR